jgi:death-on-curing protein
LIKYFEIEEIVTLTDKLLKDTGTEIAFLNRANLEFTLDSLRTKFGNDQNKDVITKKTAYLISQIVNGHPLADGNKRTAAFLSELFLRHNGFRLEVTDDEFFFELMDIASGKISEKDIRKWIHENIR